VVTASQDKTLKVWDMATLEGNETKLHARYTVHAHDKDINCVDVSINDKYIATASQDKLCKLWAAEDGKLLGTFKGHKRGVWCVRFSPVDQVIATSSGDTTIRIWSLSDMSCLKTFEGHANSVLNLRFITAGMQLVSCGSDGLVKVWNIKTEECTATLDKHEDKIWALAVDAGEKNIVSGSADSTMTFWEDVTEEETQRQMEEKKEQVEKQQKLSNYIMAKEYGSALLLALELDKPRQLLALFVTMLERSQDDAERHDAVRTFVQTLDTPHLIQLLHYLCDWNTHSKNAFIAQNVLHMILQQHQPSELIKIAPIKDILSKLIPYTERHYESMDRMIVDTYLLDYTLKCMNL
jgi:U3 small nucleolar RNA-associated protein 13